MDLDLETKACIARMLESVMDNCAKVQGHLKDTSNILDKYSKDINSKDHHLSTDWRQGSSPESTDDESNTPIFESAITIQESPKQIWIEGDGDGDLEIDVDTKGMAFSPVIEGNVSDEVLQSQVAEGTHEETITLAGTGETILTTVVEHQIPTFIHSEESSISSNCFHDQARIDGETVVKVPIRTIVPMVPDSSREPAIRYLLKADGEGGDKLNLSVRKNSSNVVLNTNHQLGTLLHTLQDVSSDIGTSNFLFLDIIRKFNMCFDPGIIYKSWVSLGLFKLFYSWLGYPTIKVLSATNSYSLVEEGSLVNVVGGVVLVNQICNVKGHMCVDIFVSSVGGSLRLHDVLSHYQRKGEIGYKCIKVFVGGYAFEDAYWLLPWGSSVVLQPGDGTRVVNMVFMLYKRVLLTKRVYHQVTREYQRLQEFQVLDISNMGFDQGILYIPNNPFQELPQHTSNIQPTFSEYEEQYEGFQKSHGVFIMVYGQEKTDSPQIFRAATHSLCEQLNSPQVLGVLEKHLRKICSSYTFCIKVQELLDSVVLCLRYMLGLLSMVIRLIPNV